MRTVVWDAGTIHAGLFMVDDDAVAYATPDGLLFAAPLNRDVRLTWPKRYRMIRGCDLTLGPQRFRLYFARPLEGAPRIREDQTTRITDALTTEYSDLIGHVSDTLGTLADVGTLVATVVSIPGEFSDQRKGQANGDAVRARLHAYE
jgi:hypothetical protein